MRKALFLLLAASSCVPDDEVSSCFVRGTLIRTPSGSVPIEELQIGDLVLAFRPEDGAVVVRRIEALHRRMVDQLRTLHVDELEIVTTGGHPFWEAERRAWITARELREGAVVVRLLEDGTTRPASVVAVRDDARAGVEVFNLTVEGPEHTFFAGAIAVHNKTFGRNVDLDVVTFENATAEALTISVRTLEVAIDERVLDGTLPVELRSEAFAGQDTSIELASRASSMVFGRIGVFGTGSETRPAVVVGLPTGARFLIAGKGRVLLEESGSEIVPRSSADHAIVRLDDGARECSAPEVPSRLTRPNADLSLVQAEIANQTRRTRVRGQTGQAGQAGQAEKEDCLEVSLQRSNIKTPLVVDFCVPDEAWPFVIGDKLTFDVAGDRDTFTLTASNDEHQLMLRSSRVATQKVGGETFTIATAFDCTITESSCQMPLAPVRLFRQSRQGTKEALSLRTPIETADKTMLWVYGGWSQLLWRARCSGGLPGDALDFITLRRLR